MSLPAAPKTSWKLYDRYTQTEIVEAIYGEQWLRWAYERPLGRLTTWALAKRAWFSHLWGWRMSRPASAARVAPFVTAYGLDPAEFAEPVSAFRSFNDFFVRRLKPTARLIAADADALVFPADGRHLLRPHLDAATEVWAKGQSFDLAELLGNAEHAAPYLGGAAVISRLAPVDYHRYHFPAAGTATAARILPGPLYSVHPLAVQNSVRYLTANKRAVTFLDTPATGRLAIVEIGATNVGSIHQTYTPGPVEKGAEKGFFAFGGSCVITLFEPGKVTFADDLATHSAREVELYAHMGDVLARRQGA